MGPEGSSLPDEPGALGSPGQDDPGLVMREPFLRQVLAEFEAGELEAYEYARRVFAINAATSVAQMQAVVDQRSDAAAVGDGPAVPPGLDAVDLARLQAAQRSEQRRPTARYVTLAVVFVLFAVLIGMGMWLATHVHGGALPAGPSGPVRVALPTSGWR